MRRERSFLPILPAYAPSRAWVEERLKKIALRYPGCTAWPAGEALLISTLIRTLENEDAKYVAWVIRKCGLQVPLRLRSDRYRLIKYLYSHWHLPEVRERILTKLILYRRTRLSQSTEALTPEKVNALLRESTPTYLLGPLYMLDLQDRAEAIIQMMDEDGLSFYRADVLIGQIICHKLWREKDPVPTSLRERRILSQRLRRRTIQLQHLQRSLYHLDRERKALVRQTWEAEQTASQSLDALIRRQQSLEAEREQMIRSHADRLAALQAGHSEALDAARKQLEAKSQALDDALAERARWSTAMPLAGRAILVLGDLNHAEAYRSAVAALGGRPVLVDGLDHFGRIREAAAEVDAAILVTAAIKHAAEAALSAAVRAGTPVFYCPRAGQASLERILRAELLPRLIAQQVAASQQGGAADAD